MTFVLLLVAILSLVTTAGLLAYVVFLRRERHEREEARVAALESAIRGEHLAPAPTLPSAGLLFELGTDTEPDSQFSRWGMTLAGAGAVVAVLFAATLWSRANGTAASQESRVVQRNDPAIELISLRHHRDEKGLTVSGLVRNPPNAGIRHDTDVVVSTFDASGELVASGRSGVVDRALAGGTGSPFSVTIPDGLQVSRYRVSFRHGTRVLPHVDRRGDGNSAAEERWP